MDDDFYRLRRERAPGTANWIAMEQQFVHWRSSLDSRSRVLLIHGAPGCGKSVLAARIVHHVLNHANSYDICLYSFCRYDDTDKQDLNAMLRSAIWQLAQQYTDYGTLLQRLRGIHEFKADDLDSLPYLWQNILIHQLEKLNCSRPIRWIIDSLDEMKTKQQVQFLEYLADLKYTKLDLKVLILARYNEDIELRLKDIGGGIIELTEEKNSADIRAYIHHNVQNSGRLSMPHIVNKLVSHLESHSQGVFLWVRMILDELRQMTTDDEIADCLNSVPTSLGQMYDRTFQRLAENLTPRHLQISKDIFGWTVFACRPLFLEELVAALKPHVGPLTCLELEIRRCCGGLIVVDRKGNVRLLHTTVAEHAIQSSLMGFVDRAVVNGISKCCVQTIPAFESFSRMLEDRSWDASYPFLTYSSQYWAWHVQSSAADNLDLWNAVLSFLTTSSALTWIKVMFLTGRHSFLPQAMKRIQKWAQSADGYHSALSPERLNLGTVVSRWLSELDVLTQAVTCTLEQYDGEHRDGRRHGWGTCEYEAGHRYKGRWEDGRCSGFGKMSFKSRNVYEGNWKNDRQHGKGVWKFSDGVSYRGSWNDGTAEEGGVWEFLDGSTRIHVPSDHDLPNLGYVNYRGACTIPFHDAVGKFEGDTDPPTWIYPNGSRYVGYWKDGHEDGYGSWCCICGCEYCGFLENGKESGQGVWSFRTGTTYTGGWKDGRQHGFGVLLFHTGHEYRGDWKNGKPDGKGVMTFVNGNKSEGTWRDGKLLGPASITFGDIWVEQMKFQNR
jgi:archaellum biogenesis ATPase FlaH